MTKDIDNKEVEKFEGLKVWKFEGLSAELFSEMVELQGFFKTFKQTLNNFEQFQIIKQSHLRLSAFAWKY